MAVLLLMMAMGNVHYILGGNRLIIRWFIPGILGLFMFAQSAAAATVSMQVIDGDIRSVIAAVARIGQLGVVVDDSVQGKVTVMLDDVEPFDALQAIAKTRALIIEENNGMLMISSAYRTSRSMFSPFIFPVKYADLGTIKEAVKISLNQAGFLQNSKNIDKETGKQIFSENEETERLQTDAATNSLILYGTGTEAEAARKIISALDVPTQQVSLEAKVIAIQKDAAKQLGVEWEWSKLPQYPEYTTTTESVRRVVVNADGSYQTVTEDVPKTTVRREHSFGESIPGIISFGRSPEGHPFEFYYAAKINALITDGKASVLARPNITTLQGKEAVINIGGEVPVPTVSTTNSTTTTSIQYKQAGIILRYTPRINPDGGITAEVHTEVSSPMYVDALKAYRFNKRSADTTVRLKDGETMVIGGLIGSEETKTLSKVPFLGDLPILGALFRNVRNSKADSEVMIFLTARILPQQ